MPSEAKHLFSAEGAAALDAIMKRRPLLAFDFDGTLATIVARPEDARVDAAVAERLGRLAQYLPLAVVSGRAADDLRGRLPFQPHFAIGNHGAEDPSASAPVSSAAALDGLRDTLRWHATELHRAGVVVEDKTYSLALHYRLAPDAEHALDMITQLMAGHSPALRVFGGKMVVNAVAAGAPDKGDAVAGLVARCGADCAFFIGDDVNDEPVFVRARPSWLTVRVGRDAPNSRAMFVLDHLDQVEPMLERMLAALEHPKPVA